MADTVAIAFTPAPAAQSPNLRRTTDAGAASAYYRAIVVAFASVRRWNPEQNLVFVSDSEPPAPDASKMAELGVRTLVVPFRHRPPEGFWPTFNASLFTIDAMDALIEHSSVEERILLMDPDVVCTGSLEPVFSDIAGGGVLVYPTGFPAYEKSQGLSALEAMPMHQLLDPELVDPPAHYGGEIYGFTPEGLRPVLARAEDAWQLSLARWADQQPRFVTEEHLLNYALRRAPLRDASRYLRRIPTAPTNRDVRGDEFSLLLWHLLSEKDRGFISLAEAVERRDSWFWRYDRQSYLSQLGRITGIPRRPPRRWLYDLLGVVVRSVQKGRRSETMTPVAARH